MNNSMEDMPDADDIGQAAFCIHVDWHTLNSYLGEDLPVPDELLYRLNSSILLVESQMDIWGTSTIEKRSKEAVLGTVSWDSLGVILSEYHTRFG